MNVESSGTTKHQFLKMSSIHGTLLQLLDYKVWNKNEIEEIVNKLLNIVKIISDNNLSHGDMHLSNIGFIYDSSNKLQLKLIDFGMSRERSLPKSDIALMLRGTQFLRNENTIVRDTFIDLVHEKTKKMFGLEFPKFTNKGSSEKDAMTMYYLGEISDKEQLKR